jgi:hypothetical protein
VGKVQSTPFGVVKFGFGKFEFASLSEISLPYAEAEIARGIHSIAELKLPAEVKQQLLAR